MTRARLIVLVAAVLAAAGAAGFLLTRSAGAGPLGWPPEPGDSWHTVNYGAIQVTPGQTVATTLDLNRSKSPAVLLGVRPLHPPDARGLTIRYAATTGQHIGSAYGWKPKAWHLHPLVGFVVPAHTSGGIMVGVSARTRGLHFLHGFVVDYRIGGTHYSAPLYQGIQLCVSRRCPSG